MLKSFSTSIKGKLLEVAYTLNCFIKHEAFTEFGEGNVVTLPIKLLQPPMHIVSTVQAPVPQGWNPQVQQQVYLAAPADAILPGQDMYYQQVMMPEQQNWEQAGLPRQEDVKALKRETMMVKKAAEEGVEDDGTEPLSPGQEQVMY